jgi:hypothetical protein
MRPLINYKTISIEMTSVYKSGSAIKSYAIKYARDS